MSRVTYLDTGDEEFDFPELLQDGRPFRRAYQTYREGDLIDSEETITLLAIASKIKKNPHPYVADVYSVASTYFDAEIVDTTGPDWDGSDLQRLYAIAPVVKDHLQSLGIYMRDWSLDNFGMNKHGEIKFCLFDCTEAAYLSYHTPYRAYNVGASDKELDDKGYDRWMKSLRGD